MTLQRVELPRDFETELTPRSEAVYVIHVDDVIIGLPATV
jgi:hypothetical protein